MTRNTLPPPLARTPTGIPGLDEVTGGGLMRAGVYIVQGAPGAGKTILANQMAFGHAATGGRVAYVTMLAESHARLFQHLSAFSFYRDAAIPEQVFFVSAFDALRRDGLAGVVALLRGEMRARQAGLLVLDGLVMAASAAASTDALKLFVSDIQSYASAVGCTTLLLTSDDADRPVSAEQTMVDGILLLRERAWAAQRERNLEVVKFRGSATLRGNHSFRIGDDGIRVFPRLESARRESPGDAIRPQTIDTGIEGLDRMLGAGLRRGTMTAITGYTGTGKTTFALHFAARATPAEPCLWFSFYESPEFLVDIAAALGLDLGALRRSGALHFLWQPFGENLLDELAYRLIDTVAAAGARRVVIDGIGGFIAEPAFAERGGAFLASLANALRRLGATTWLLVEETRADRPTEPVSTPTMSAICDNMIRLCHRHDGRMRHFLTVDKARGARADDRLRRLRLDQGRLRVDHGSDDTGDDKRE